MSYRRELTITDEEMEKLRIPRRYWKKYRMLCFTQGLSGDVEPQMQLLEELGEAEYKLSLIPENGKEENAQNSN